MDQLMRETLERRAAAIFDGSAGRADGSTGRPGRRRSAGTTRPCSTASTALLAAAAGGRRVPVRPDHGRRHHGRGRAAVPAAPWPPVGEAPGDRVGPYKLLEQIGEGGFGVVFMAEQERPVRRPVALKVIKVGMDTKEVVARFEAERQALALMDHPNIARVFDAGSTATGRPYFAMELVRGSPDHGVRRPAPADRRGTGSRWRRRCAGRCSTRTPRASSTGT